MSEDVIKRLSQLGYVRCGDVMVYIDGTFSQEIYQDGDIIIVRSYDGAPNYWVYKSLERFKNDILQIGEIAQ